MRIISDYHDYYDGLMNLDQDRSVIYHRKSSEIRFNDPIVHIERSERYYSICPYFYFVGFCGKVYKFLQYRFKCAYNEQDSTLLSQEMPTADYNWYKNTYKRFFDTEFRFKTNYFDTAPVWMCNAQRAILGWHNSVVILNPCLKDINFRQVLKPDQAYQELLMWHNNLAMPEKPIPKIDDKTMAEAKGFDRFSFRKSKHEKS